MSEVGEVARTLPGALRQMVAQWWAVQNPGQVTKTGQGVEQGMRPLEELAGFSAGRVWDLMNRVFPSTAGSRRGRTLPGSVRTRNAWPDVLTLVNICVPEPEREDWRERLAWLWTVCEGDSVERPPGYLGRLRRPDGPVLPALDDPRDTDRPDLKLPLFVRQVTALHAELDRVRDAQQQSRQMQEELEHARQQLTATQAAVTELQRLVAAGERALADQAQLHEEQLQAAEAARHQLEQKLTCTVQDLLDEQARQNRRLADLAADRDRIARQHDAAARLLADEVTHRRSVEHQLTAKDRELVAARARIDQLTAQVAALTDQVKELTSALNARPTKPATHHEQPVAVGFTIASTTPPESASGEAPYHRPGTKPLVTAVSPVGETRPHAFSVKVSDTPSPAQTGTGAEPGRGEPDDAAAGTTTWDLRWWGYPAGFLIMIGFMYGMLLAAVAQTDRDSARRATFPVMDAVVGGSSIDSNPFGYATTYALAVTDPRTGTHFDSSTTLDGLGGLTKGEYLRVRIDPTDHHAVPDDNTPVTHHSSLTTQWKILALGMALSVVVALSAIHRDRPPQPRKRDEPRPAPLTSYAGSWGNQPSWADSTLPPMPGDQ
ncbi:ATP-binding protein [Krasilnikovia sp. MM14-A1004]|uniref:ATP-binding protein n=1 Tax=Krasilnikovia sp. MM14-A1004 TaxID=3373541 RepID=UPI00399D25BC